MTPGWLSVWQKQLEHIMGFDQATAKKCFQETVRGLLLVDTGVNSNSESLLADMSDYLQIPAERIVVGLDYYSKLLQRLVADAKLTSENNSVTEALKQQSEYAMVADLLGKLTEQKNEYGIIQNLIVIFQTLLAPDQCCYIPWEKGVAGTPVCTNQSRSTNLIDSIGADSGEYALLDEDGFWFRISNIEEIFGFIVIEKIAFPQYRTQYLNMALMIKNVVALTFNHVRDFQKLSDLLHNSGKAQVAREVIHNAGNVLNSINISVQQLQSLLDKSSNRSLPQIVELMKEQGSKLGEFITSDPRGQKIPDYLDQLVNSEESEQHVWQQYLSKLANDVAHIRAIVQSQNTSLKTDEPTEVINPLQLLNYSVDIFSERIKQLNIELDLQIEPVSACPLQKHKVLQVLNNLLANAIEELSAIDSSSKKLSVRLGFISENRIYFEVMDNGFGIAHDLQKKIFAHGFTTKEGHQGFGLHSAANLASEMGGELTCLAVKNGKGTCFRLELPTDTLNA